jgi:hypothetical protein
MTSLSVVAVRMCRDGRVARWMSTSCSPRCTSWPPCTFSRSRAAYLPDRLIGLTHPTDRRGRARADQSADPRRLGGGPKRLAQLSARPTNMGLVMVATLASIVPGLDNIEDKRAGFPSRPACDVSLMPIGTHRATAGRRRPQGVGRSSFRPRRTLRARRSRAASRCSSSMCCLLSIAVESRSM